MAEIATGDGRRLAKMVKISKMADNIDGKKRGWPIVLSKIVEIIRHSTSTSEKNRRPSEIAENNRRHTKAANVVKHERKIFVTKMVESF